MPANPEAIARTKELLKQLWEQHKPTVFERLEVLERVSADALKMDAAALEEARSAAHKLAGALGTFGFQQATDWARDSEQIFMKGHLDSADQARLMENARNIRELLENQKA
jgi:HPt (histidine-containing phosphotransfer) domain-containing protein